MKSLMNLKKKFHLKRESEDYKEKKICLLKEEALSDHQKEQSIIRQGDDD